nr:hypothetical protein [Fibrobacter sp. UWS1]
MVVTPTTVNHIIVISANERILAPIEADIGPINLGNGARFIVTATIAENKISASTAINLVISSATEDNILLGAP